MSVDWNVICDGGFFGDPVGNIESTSITMKEGCVPFTLTD